MCGGARLGTTGPFLRFEPIKSHLGLRSDAFYEAELAFVASLGQNNAPNVQNRADSGPEIVGTSMRQRGRDVMNLAEISKFIDLPEHDDATLESVDGAAVSYLQEETLSEIPKQNVHFLGEMYSRRSRVRY